MGVGGGDEGGGVCGKYLRFSLDTISIVLPQRHAVSEHIIIITQVLITPVLLATQLSWIDITIGYN